MSTAVDSRGNASQGGFQRWVKLPTDDLPLIRPPRHHMLAHITGGLTKLYDFIKENKKDDPETTGEKTDAEKSEGGKENGPTDNGLCNNDGSENCDTDATQSSQEKETEKSSDDKQEKNSQNEKKDDEGGGKSKSESADGVSAMEEEEEETTPYTDVEGEFSPEKGMPYLAGRYKYTSVLARGQSAIIIKVLDTFHNDKPLAIKVLHRVYKPIGSQEADILLELHRADPWLHVPFARLLNQFLYGPHYCLVFAYLSPTPLYNHYDQRDIREASSLPHVRDLTVKLLTVLGFLYKQNVIHADLKPENILLINEENLSSILVVDFGNALRNTDEELSLYYSDFELQTLLYRAPEVMFGMKFSLEVDMWSLGCLLAECYLGEPLFVGKTKKEILNKTTTLLGPFPKEFNEGEYSKEFAEFVGRPMSRYQRLENLRKRLNDCKDSTFLMLVERLLTYLPDRRFTPFEAACHPFVACSTPFLYLTPSPGFIRYPTILVDMSTYPYLPGLPDDEDENSASALSRKRLASFARVKPSPQTTPQAQGQKEKDPPTPTGNATSGTPAPPPPPPKKDNPTDIQKPPAIPKPITSVVGPDGKTATRSDVKETLKSMGLRCEDFTISVYSREQAHAILRRQGVEVTPNNLPAREKLAAMTNKGGYRNAQQMQRMPFNMRSFPPTNAWPANTRTNTRAPNTRKFVPRYEADDDDDCVILDPPDAPKPAQPALPQQFQLMGTTVQVNRGAKRPNRPMMNQPQAKRQNARPMQYYHKDHEEYGAEASVQDTLKRLKNYNISITCRRNAAGYSPRGAMESSSDMDEGLMDSEDEEDMTKYLECQIGEIDDIPEQEIFDDEEIDCDDKSDLDYTPRGKKKKKTKSPRKGRRSVDPVSVSDGPRTSESGMEVNQLDSSLLDSSLEVVGGVQMGSVLSSETDQEIKDSSSPVAPSDNENDKAMENVSEHLNAAEGETETEKNSSDFVEMQDEELSQYQEEDDSDPLGQAEADGDEEQENKTEDGPAENDEEVGEREEYTTEDQTDYENKEDDTEMEEQSTDNVEDVSDNIGDMSENIEDMTENVEDIINKEMSENQPQGGTEDEEIDAELEEELLSGDVGDEGDMEEQL